MLVELLDEHECEDKKFRVEESHNSMSEEVKVEESHDSEALSTFSHLFFNSHNPMTEEAKAPPTTVKLPQLKVEKIMADLAGISVAVQKVAETIRSIEELSNKHGISFKTQSENLEVILNLIQIHTSAALTKSSEMLNRLKTTDSPFQGETDH